MARSLGIDIGGTSVKLALIDGPETIWTAQSPFYTRPDTRQLQEAIVSSLKSPVNGVATAGICVPGRLDREKRQIMLSVNVPGLMGITLDNLVAGALGQPIAGLKIINDAVATASDVIRAKGYKGRVMSIALGTGVGMGILDDGAPLFIEGASPGHIGQFDVSLDDNPPIGPDGGAGSLEGYIGVPALRRDYGSVANFLQKADRTAPPLRALARAIRIGHAIYRPKHVVLVGGVGTRMKHLLSDLHAIVSQNLTSVADPEWTLDCGESDFHAAIGAARLAAS